MTPLIIPVFLPNMGCKKRCLFCNQRGGAEGLLSPSSVRNFINTSLAGFPPNHLKREKQVAFYGGSFTAIQKGDQINYLGAIEPFITSGLIDSIRISTRPDALDEEVLSLLKEFRVKTVEVGAQSMIDQILFLSQRGHLAEDTLSATLRLKSWGFEVGLHLMIGLPGDSLDYFLQTLDRVINLKPDFVRIHPTLVLKGAPLEILWREGRYSPLSLNEGIEWLKKGVLLLERSSIPVVRIGLQPTKELEEDFLAGPFHPAIHQLVNSAIAFDMAKHLLQIYQKDDQAIFFCHPKEVSDLIGQKNENILKLKEKFRLREIFVRERSDLRRGSLILQTAMGDISMDRRDLS